MCPCSCARFHQTHLCSMMFLVRLSASVVQDAGEDVRFGQLQLRDRLPKSGRF